MSHAGDLTPQQAWDRLAADPGATLVDVRTGAELTYVGGPDLASLGKDVVAVEWTGYPDGARNPRFLDELGQAGVEKDSEVYFICRSGARSAQAAQAATEAGSRSAHNVTEGFEGDLGPGAHRDVNGWRNAGLPWRQG